MAHDQLQFPRPFERIMQRHEREIMGYLLRVSGDRDDAADLFQESWLRAYRAYPRLEPASEVRPWLYAIAVNLCRNRARVIATDDAEQPAGDTIGNARRSHNENEGYAAIRMRELISALKLPSGLATW